MLVAEEEGLTFGGLTVLSFPLSLSLCLCLSLSLKTEFLCVALAVLELFIDQSSLELRDPSACALECWG